MAVLAKGLKTSLVYFLYLIIIWSLYRVSGITLPQEFDEFVVKPVVWIGPILFILYKEKKGLGSLGFTPKNLYPGVYLALILGLIFAVEAFVINYLKYGGVDLSANLGGRPFLYVILISLVTALSEEVAFRGFLFARMLAAFKNEILATLIVSVFWVMVHIPATFALLGYDIQDAMSYLLLALFYSIGACFIYARTKNIFSSILLFVLWEATIILFR